MDCFPSDIKHKDANCFILDNFIDGNMLCIISVKNETIEDEPFNEALKLLKKFMKYAYENNKKFHFIFDAHKCETIPAGRINEIQKTTYKRTYIIEECLVSTCIIIKNRALKILLDLSFQVWTPLKPLDIILHEQQEFTIGKYGIPDYLMKESLQIFKSKKKEVVK